MNVITLTIKHEAGLHARPLAQFVRKAKGFNADIRVSNLTREKGPVNGKSPLNLLLLAVSQGHQIRIEAEGPEAEQALTALETLVNDDFREKPSLAG